MSYRVRLYVRGMYAGEVEVSFPQGVPPLRELDEVHVVLVRDHARGERALLAEGRLSAVDTHAEHSSRQVKRTLSRIR